MLWCNKVLNNTGCYHLKKCNEMISLNANTSAVENVNRNTQFIVIPFNQIEFKGLFKGLFQLVSVMLILFNYEEQID